MFVSDENKLNTHDAVEKQVCYIELLSVVDFSELNENKNAQDGVKLLLKNIADNLEEAMETCND